MTQNASSRQVALLTTMALLFLFIPKSEAVHLYRSEDGGCSAASGELTDDPAAGEHGRVAAEVLVLHNTFHDTANGTPVTRVRAGEAVRWLWASSHCHSVDGRLNASAGTGRSERSAMKLATVTPSSAPGLGLLAAAVAFLCVAASLASVGMRTKGLWLLAALVLSVCLVAQSSCGGSGDDAGPLSSSSGIAESGLAFYSGFHFPEKPPDSPQAIPGAFEYPLPDPQPSLTYVHTFETPGTFPYACEHHGLIGMAGVVIVEE